VIHTEAENEEAVAVVETLLAREEENPGAEELALLSIFSRP